MSDAIVIGGGIAGLLLAKNLLNHDKTVVVVDANHQQRGSSSPRAIMHAFPGRSFQPHPLLEEAFLISCRQMEIWEKADHSLVGSCQMIRPLKGRGAERLTQSFQSHWANCSDKWITFLEEDKDQIGTIQYKPAYAVNLDGVCSLLKRQLKAAGVEFINDTVSQLHQTGAEWITIGEKMTLKSESIALALGLKCLDFFPDLGLIEGGDILTMEAKWNPNHIVACDGLHAAPMANEKEIAIGSTRWPTDAPLSEEDAKNQLRQRAMAMAWVDAKAQAKNLWRGTRAVWPKDRMPICGAVPNKKGLFTLLNLGGKALLWGPASAKWLAEQMANGRDIPHAISSQRIEDNAWRSNRIKGQSTDYAM